VIFKINRLSHIFLKNWAVFKCKNILQTNIAVGQEGEIAMGWTSYEGHGKSGDGWHES
jgi:hypothetical protein